MPILYKNKLTNKYEIANLSKDFSIDKAIKVLKLNETEWKEITVEESKNYEFEE